LSFCSREARKRTTFYWSAACRILARPRRANYFRISENRVKPQNKKYFALSEGQISGRYCLSRPTRGALAIATNVRWDAVDAEVMMAIVADAYGKDVWS
jgi:hypothetical protein